MNYLDIKLLHLTCAIASIMVFSGRTWLKLNKSELLRQRWLKILPHCIDATLLGSAITMVVLSQQYPTQQAWLTAKVIALLVYIGLGFVVMRIARNQQQRIGAFVLALLTYAYIVSVAINKTPIPWL